tara:strand:+ start:1600 stop:2124 length:525 start_codon:yes stop_codon:yes gene_type:complete
MEATTSHVKIYNISPELAEDFEFDYDTISVEEGSSDILGELAPHLDQWSDMWVEAEEYEYNSHDQTMHFTLHTKWAPPINWLTQASMNTYFHNRLITMVTIQKDETCATGVAVMDGEVLQKKIIFEMTSEEVGKYYNDDEVEYELDELDNKIWDSAGKFLSVCQQFYLERKEDD